MQHQNWNCMKCGNHDYEAGEIRTTGGVFTKIFDVQSKKFATVTCTQCSFTEIYKSSTSTLENVFDFFTK